MSRSPGSDAQSSAAKPRDAERRPPDPAEDRKDVDPTGEGEVEERDSSGGPGSPGWWLDDGPTSPIAADIEEPEKHL